MRQRPQHRMLATGRHRHARGLAVAPRRDRIGKLSCRADQLFEQVGGRKPAEDNGFGIEHILDGDDRVAEDRRNFGHPCGVADVAAATCFEREIPFEAAMVAAGTEFAAGNGGDVSDFARISPGAAHHRAVMDDDAAKADAEIEVVIFGIASPKAIEALAHGSCRHVGLEEGRQPGRCRQPLRQRDILPAGHGRGADEAHRFHAERPGQRHADAKHAAAGPQCSQFGHHGADQVEGMVGRCMRRLAMRAFDDIAAEIDQRSVDAERGEVDADGIAAFRVDTERSRRQSAPARLFAQRQHIAVLFELANDGRYGLDGEADAAGNVAAGNGAVQADGLQHDAPVVGPSELLVGSPQCHFPLPRRDETCTGNLFSQMEFKNNL